MAYPLVTPGQEYGTAVAATPAYTGTFIPEIWSGKIIK